MKNPDQIKQLIDHMKNGCDAPAAESAAAIRALEWALDGDDGSMTAERHRKRHVALHEAFDELIADYLFQVKGSLPSTTTTLQLMAWSHAQTIEPTFRCSRCGRVSHNPNDAEQKYCGACHAFVEDPA
jgi:hypothetical protein